MRRRLVIPFACLLLFAAADALMRSMRRSQAESAPVASPWLTRPFALADFPATDLDGRDRSPAQWRGKVGVINFWATWCGPCRVEIPDLVALQRRHPDDLVVLGVAQDESPADDIRRFTSAMGVNYPVVIGRWEIETAFSEVLALPTTYLVDRSGRVVAHYLGQFDAKSFERDVERLVADRSVARAEARSVDAPPPR